MHVKWDGETYEVDVKRKKIPRIKLYPTQGGKVLAKVPIDATEEEIQQSLDEKAEWIAKTARNAKRTASEQEQEAALPAIVPERQLANRNTRDDDSAAVAVPAEDLTAYSADVDVLDLVDIRCAIEERKNARRITAHIVGPLQVILMVPPGTPDNKTFAYFKKYLETVSQRDLNPDLSRRALRRMSSDDFIYVRDLYVRDLSGTAKEGIIPDNFRIYISRKDVSEYTLDPISQNELWFYVPWSVPTKAISKAVYEHVGEMANAVAEYAYRNGLGKLKEHWIERFVCDGSQHDIEVHREDIESVEHTIGPTVDAVLHVPWGMPNFLVKEWLEEHGETIVRQRARVRAAEELDEEELDEEELDETTPHSVDDDLPVRILGKELQTKIVSDQSNYVKETPKELIIHTSGKAAAAVTLATWWQNKLRFVIQTYLDKWLPVLRSEGLSDVKFSVRPMKKYCKRSKFSKRKVSFNPGLLGQPRDILEYVVLNQLLAMVPHRSREWRTAFLDKYMPNWHDYAMQLVEQG